MGNDNVMEFVLMLLNLTGFPGYFGVDEESSYSIILHLYLKDNLEDT
jgi:hypothetical protein